MAKTTPHSHRKTLLEDAGIENGEDYFGTIAQCTKFCLYSIKLGLIEKQNTSQAKLFHNPKTVAQSESKSPHTLVVPWVQTFLM
jgi:hypothetical protein